MSAYVNGDWSDSDYVKISCATMIWGSQNALNLTNLAWTCSLFAYIYKFTHSHNIMTGSKRESGDELMHMG